ncbi:LigT-like protein [Marasmius fiardii PR-910]|nr:LigT-like protein [Marasmius fiardii PR-910]
MGITLWIVPSEGDILKLKRIMDIRPSSDSGSGKSAPEDTSYPRFDPHITLAALPSPSDISLTQLRQSVPQDQGSLKVNFKSVDVGDHFFRSVYVAVELTPELVDLHRSVHETLKLQPRTPMFPHISLCYIINTDAEHGERQRFRDEIAGRIREVGNGTIELNCGVEGENWLSGFEAPEIWIAECEGPVESWKILDRIKLS